MKLLCPSDGKGYILALKPLNFFLSGQKVVENLETKFTFKKYHEAYQTHQRNVLDAKMCGPKIAFCETVNSGESWPKLVGRISSSSFGNLKIALPGGGGGDMDARRRRGGGGGLEKWGSVSGPLFCVRTDVGAEGAGTPILARKVFFHQ